MFIKGNLRKHPRTPFVTPLKYYLSVSDVRELKRIHNTAVSVDISTGGIGIITDYPLETGHVLNFVEKINNIASKFAIVRWASKIDVDKYRIGLKLI